MGLGVSPTLKIVLQIAAHAQLRDLGLKATGVGGAEGGRQVGGGLAAALPFVNGPLWPSHSEAESHLPPSSRLGLPLVS